MSILSALEFVPGQLCPFGARIAVSAIRDPSLGCVYMLSNQLLTGKFIISYEMRTASSCTNGPGHPPTPNAPAINAPAIPW